MEIKNLRHEIRKSVSDADVDILRQFMKSANGWNILPAERVHILHFERPDNKGQDTKKKTNREKFSLVYRNDETEDILLVKKSRRKDCFLERASALSRSECEGILAGDYDCLSGTPDPLIFELYNHLLLGDLRPKILVDLRRETYACPKANVQAAVESDFYTGLNTNDFLNDRHPTIKRAGQVALEVKYDKALPEIFVRLVGGEKKARAAAPVFAYPGV